METKEYTINITHVSEMTKLSLKAIGNLIQAVEFAEALDGDVIEIREENKTIVTIDRRN